MAISDRAEPSRSGHSMATHPVSAWPFRWSLAVAATIFPLIWVGGLVTTQDAGMAVPDWPNTNGYNMFAYPVSAWIYGPFDLFIEHGHRLLGSFVGLLAIGLCGVLWRKESRAWVCWLGAWLLLAIILQGMLGGFRVLLDARTLALIHGCSGPLVFALAVSVVVVTSRAWREPSSASISSRWFAWLSIGLTLSSVVQLILGAQLRHVQPWAKPGAFTGLVHLHLTFAAIVAILVVLAVITSLSRSHRRLSGIGWPILTLLVLLWVQIALGIGTWIANYGWPWIEGLPALAGYTIATKGYWESWIVTGHQATGSLIIATAVVLALRIWRQTSVVSNLSTDVTDPHASTQTTTATLSNRPLKTRKR